MSDVTFDFALFQGQFPSFEDPPFLAAVVEAQWDIATCYISESTNCFLNEKCLPFAINAMTAHLLQLGVNSGAVAPGGNTVGNVVSASIDKVSVTNEAPPANASQFHYWLNQTPYGKQLLALLKIKATGGILIGGLPERSGFRKVGGVF